MLCVAHRQTTDTTYESAREASIPVDGAEVGYPTDEQWFQQVKTEEDTRNGAAERTLNRSLSFIG